METVWEWRWEFDRWTVDLTIDLCSFMFGIAWGPRGDIVIHFACGTICAEPWPLEHSHG